MVIIISGLPGSGKSYFASRLAVRINAVYISSDRVRKKMLAARTYSAREKLLIYEEMLAQAKQAAGLKKNVVLDATFYKKQVREKFIKELSVQDSIFFIEVRAGESVIKKRLAQKREDSEADFNVYKIIKAQWEPLQEDHLVLQSEENNINDMLDKAADYLHLKND